ncbi:putative glycosyl transferase [Mycobacterium tuberculosis]|nr:putative glycosyl transferase [Mycobacterium tuberculosis]CFR75228.1 putative glycosyl transferase [Mycobacterium tuberculosis]CKR57629.1 putative glycosyl transferase [Mycobacterium tuberculosis]CNX16683.1 putative glycosyl transferase [Mycobacterium tuberculosis]CNX17384.1 putative glycosyl transferase [Mycobacterium tuberculosis]
MVLCNGGSPTTQQALAAGVPVIGLPSNMDQHLNMEALERAGAGVLLRTERLNTEGVAAAVKQVLSGAEFRQAARRLAEAFGPDFAGFPQHIESALRLVC